MEHNEKPGAVALVEPVEGWEAMGPYGLQRCGPGPADRLVRLEEVLAWMCLVKERPVSQAVKDVFYPLVQWDEADRDRRCLLYALNDQDYAQPLEVNGRANPAAQDAWGEMACIGPDDSAQGIARQVMELWQESWPGYLAEPAVFYQKGWVKYCKAMKQLARSEYGEPYWQEEYRERYYMSQEAWRERCLAVMRVLRQLCVPLHVAHELWGWGTVAQASKAASLVPSQVQAFAELVAYRQQFASLPHQQRPKWQPEHVALVAQELAQEHATGHGAGAVGRLAERLGYSRRRLEELLDQHGYTTAGQPRSKPAGVFDGLQRRAG